jgi:hypothetical protein
MGERQDVQWTRHWSSHNATGPDLSPWIAPLFAWDDRDGGQVERRRRGLLCFRAASCRGLFHRSARCPSDLVNQKPLDATQGMSEAFTEGANNLTLRRN